MTALMQILTVVQETKAKRDRKDSCNDELTFIIFCVLCDLLEEAHVPSAILLIDKVVL